MCRVLSYLGQPILLEELLYKPDNSLVTQSHNPKLMSHLLNLAGFGFTAWNKRSENPETPFQYRTHSLPFYDENLHNLATKISTDCMIAHVRGIEYSEKNVVSDQNVHPFKFDNSSIAFAHNGSLLGLQEMKFELLKNTKEEYRNKIRGTTDSEYMYAFFLSQLPSDHSDIKIEDIFSALVETFRVLKRIRKKNHISISSPLNFFISNGEFIVASRFVFDYGHYPSVSYSSHHMGYHSLWYTFGEKYGLYEGNYQMKPSKKMNSVIIASEPLTQDSTTWIEVPEYSLIGVSLKNGKPIMKSFDIII